MLRKSRWMFLVAGCILSSLVAAQQYPARAIRFITIGADDAMPRLVAQELAAPLGQQVFIEEHAGASGTIGAEAGARAAADGYTFLVATGSLMATPHFYKLSYDIIRDFEPVTMLATTPFVLLAHPSLPVKTLADLIKLAKAKPGSLNYSATATGSTSMLSCEMFKAAAGVSITHVPYKSISAALTDVLAGQVDLGMSVTPSALAQIKGHRVRPLAVTTPQRSAVLPDVPTFTELGYDVALPAWFGLLAPAKTPPAIVARMNAEVVKIMRRPAMRERVLSFALDHAEGTPDEMVAFMKTDMARWTEAVKAAKLVSLVNR